MVWGVISNTIPIYLPNFIRMRKIVVAVLVVSTIIGGCAKSSSSVICTYDACSLKAPANEITQLESYLSGAGITTATKHCSGMYYQIKSAGSGTTPTHCSYVSVNYKGTLTNGNVFDQTTTAPANFPLATLIESWRKGIPLIQKGGSITMYIPPTLGYGYVDQKDASGNIIIPSGSILIFDVQLVDVQ